MNYAHVMQLGKPANQIPGTPFPSPWSQIRAVAVDLDELRHAKLTMV